MKVIMDKMNCETRGTVHVNRPQCPSNQKSGEMLQRSFISAKANKNRAERLQRTFISAETK